MNTWLALITQFAILIAAIAALITSMQNNKKITDVHVSINSRMDQLLKFANAKGRQDERDSNK